MTPTRMHAIMSGEDRSFRAKLARLGLSCASPFYRAIIAMRNGMFDCGFRKPVKLPRPVISIGNITTGGTGKTPMVMELAARLLAMGEKPGILTRGYREVVKQDGAEKTSDEVELFLAAFGDSVPVEVNANRADGAAAMLEKHPEVSVFLLDDGYQHRQVFRDLDIVLIDATQPFGYGRLLPRGLLREPMKNLKRADVIIITRSNEVPQQHLADLSAQLTVEVQHNLVVHAQQQWRQLRQHDDAVFPIEHLKNTPLFAFTGIGNPKAFEQMLHRHADRVADSRIFADHHAYGTEDVRLLIDQAKACGAQAMVTTEKDWTKLRAIIDWNKSPIDLFRPVLDVVFPNQEQWRALEMKIKACLAR